MEPLIVGCLTAATAVVGVAFWQVLVRPEAMLALWADPRGSEGWRADGWFDHHPGALRALRYTLGMVLFMSGFLTGLALTFLLGT
jgi:hypothetical protein